jgi:hypothetical protein
MRVDSTIGIYVRRVDSMVFMYIGRNLENIHYLQIMAGASCSQLRIDSAVWRTFEKRWP